MNMAYQNYQDDERDDQQSSRESSGQGNRFEQRKKLTYSRRGKGPTSYNGIHRRRNKRFTW
jgi:hypothetical protein